MSDDAERAKNVERELAAECDDLERQRDEAWFERDVAQREARQLREALNQRRFRMSAAAKQPDFDAALRAAHHSRLTHVQWRRHLEEHEADEATIELVGDINDHAAAIADHDLIIECLNYGMAKENR